jgi:AcrR family transcriptional regulator
MPKKSNAEHSLQTRGRLVEVATPLFSRQGYDGTSAEHIVRAARLTRGALYHHFGGKEGLFAAVLEQQMRRLKERLADAGKHARSPIDALRAGIHVYLQTCLDDGFRTIVLIDGPTVMGWKTWRALDLKLGLGLLKGVLGHITGKDADVLAQLIAGALIDGAMVVAQEPKRAKEVERTLWRLVAGALSDARSA